MLPLSAVPEVAPVVDEHQPLQCDAANGTASVRLGHGGSAALHLLHAEAAAQAGGRLVRSGPEPQCRINQQKRAVDGSLANCAPLAGCHFCTERGWGWA